MKILSVNAGSSSLKFPLFEMPEKEVIVNGTFEKIGLDNSFYTIKYNGEKVTKEASLPTHKEAVEILLNELIDMKIINSYEEIKGIGHRVLHGGDVYFDSVKVNQDVMDKIEELFPLGPLHNPANLIGIKSFISVLPNTPQVAVFDTAFHQTMDKEEYIYPIPFDWFIKYGVRKYGFHGTSHKYISKFISDSLNKNPKLINCHIGNGASICAIKDGKCIDTSMGLTPLAGIMMGSRSGDIDPSIIPYVMKQTGLSAEEIVTKLNKESGVLGISGISSDMREVEKGYLENDERCVLAFNMYVKKIINYISMYNTLLEGAEVITFTAGVGENSDLIRKLVCDKLKCLGVILDDNKNNGLRGKFEKISSTDSKIDVYVVPTDEEVMIAKDTYDLIN